MDSNLPNSHCIDGDDIPYNAVDPDTFKADPYDIERGEGGQIHPPNIEMQCVSYEALSHHAVDGMSPNMEDMPRPYFEEYELHVIETEQCKSIMSNDSDDHYSSTHIESKSTEINLHTPMQRKHEVTLNKLKEVCAKLQEMQPQASTSYESTNMTHPPPLMTRHGNTTTATQELATASALLNLIVHLNGTQALQRLIDQTRLDGTNVNISRNFESSVDQDVAGSSNTDYNSVCDPLPIPMQNIVNLLQVEPAVYQLFNIFMESAAQLCHKLMTSRDVINNDQQQRYKLAESIQASWILLWNFNAQKNNRQPRKKSFGARSQADYPTMITMENRDIQRRFHNSCPQLSCTYPGPNEDSFGLAIAYSMDQIICAFPQATFGYHLYGSRIKSSIHTALCCISSEFCVSPISYASRLSLCVENNHTCNQTGREAIVMDELPDLVPEFGRIPHPDQIAHSPDSPENVEPINPQAVHYAGGDQVAIRIDENLSHRDEIGTENWRYYRIKCCGLFALFSIPVVILFGVYAYMIYKAYPDKTKQKQDDIESL